MEKKFLIMVEIDGNVCSTMANDIQVVHFVDFLDCMDVEGYKIFDCSKFGAPRELEYIGWRPGCKIVLVDKEYGNVVIEGIGTDH